MAVTHADLEIDRVQPFGGKIGDAIMLFCAVLGIITFMLCLIAETDRSEVLWTYGEIPMSSIVQETAQCVYTRSGKVPTACAVCALTALIVTLVLSQAYLGVSLCNPSSTEKASPLDTWISNSRISNSRSISSLRWKAATLFSTVWISFAVATVLLVIGVAVEAQHISDGRGLHPKCLVVRKGLFAAAGVFSLSCTFLSLGLYFIALQTQRVEEAAAAAVREEVIEAGARAFGRGAMENHGYHNAGMLPSVQREAPWPGGLRGGEAPPPSQNKNLRVGV